jgi:hypothetical protein
MRSVPVNREAPEHLPKTRTAGTHQDDAQSIARERPEITMMQAAMNARDDELLFVNEAWAVTNEGLEHRSNGYFIPREELGARRSDGLWTWPVHMAEKLWCGPKEFTEAFMQAVRAYGLQADAGLALSFLDAGRIQGEQASYAAVAAALMTAEPTPARNPALPLQRPRYDDAREATAHPWRRSRVARAGLTLLEWLRHRASGAGAS